MVKVGKQVKPLGVIRLVVFSDALDMGISAKSSRSFSSVQAETVAY